MRRTGPRVKVCARTASSNARAEQQPRQQTAQPPALPPAGNTVDLFLQCPHCNGLVSVYTHDIKCTIFRHGIWKHNGKPINPHLPKKECDRLFAEGLIHGCGKPFKFDGVNLSVCDYI